MHLTGNAKTTSNFIRFVNQKESNFANKEENFMKDADADYRNDNLEW